MSTLRRRRFLQVTIGGGIVAAGGALAGSRASWRAGKNPPTGDLPSVSRTSRALGSHVSMTALHVNRDTASAALGAAFDELELVEDLLSIYRPASQLSRLNREHRLANPHPYLVEVLERSQALAARSQGAFDVTVQPLWNVYAEAHRNGRLPDEAALNAARLRVDWRRLVVSPDEIRLDGDGMQVTLNGIAQGFAADRAAAVLRSHGIEHALIDTGEIGTLGGKSAVEPWKVGIQHPREPEAYVSLARLAGRSLATSGDYATHFSPDRQYNHIFDPRSGHSPEEFASVSIAAPCAMDADALSTAVFVLGVDRGLELICSTPVADALFVLKNGRTMNTKGFPLA